MRLRIGVLLAFSTFLACNDRAVGPVTPGDEPDGGTGPGEDARPGADMWTLPDLGALPDSAVHDDGPGGCAGDACGPPPDTRPAAICGNAVIEDGESCDDGNPVGGDGCSGLCRLEPWYVCPLAGAPCTRTIVCGDGKKDGNEACDDGNAVAGDGCAADCLAVEPGWSCVVPNQACVRVTTVACGDGKVDSGENCDDGNTASGDGCSATCQLEGVDWTCPMPGKACLRLEYCGAGRLPSVEA